VLQFQALGFGTLEHFLELVLRELAASTTSNTKPALQ
jgi:hypothetical protein